MAPLPLVKIVAVLIKEVSKPIAAYLKRAASEHPRLRTATMALGRSYERGVQRVEVLWTNAGRIKSFKHIPDAHALSVGADLLTQGFLLTTAIGLVCAEYWRGARIADAERAAAAVRKGERQAVKNERLAALEARVEAALARVEAFERAAARMEAAAGARAAAAEAEALERAVAEASAETQVAGAAEVLEPEMLPIDMGGRGTCPATIDADKAARS